MEQGEVKEIFANPKTAAAKRLVAPNGGSAARDLSSFAPDDHVVRVTFNGSSAAKPVVASLAAEKGILVSVLSAHTRDLSGQCYGSMPVSYTPIGTLSVAAVLMYQAAWSALSIAVCALKQHN